MPRGALVASCAVIAACAAEQPHAVCLPSATSGPQACPWHDPKVLGPVMPPPDAYPTCGYIVWTGPGHDFVIKPRPDETFDYPCWTTPDRAVRRTFSSKEWRVQHGGPQEVPP